MPLPVIVKQNIFAAQISLLVANKLFDYGKPVCAADH